MSVIRFVPGSYPISVDAFWVRARKLLDEAANTGNAALIFYATLELRFAIENFLRSYLELVAPNRQFNYKTLYAAKKLGQEILKQEPQFEEKIQFLSLALKFLDTRGLERVDFNRLSKLYGVIGDYLHAPFSPSNTVDNPDWWNRILEVLDDVINYLPSVARLMASINLSPEGRDFFSEWKRGEISDDEVSEIFEREYKPNSSA